MGKGPVAPQIVDALKRLEYRGYDSAGIATLEHGHLERRRAGGKLVNLEARLKAEPLAGHAGIGHTRWATHGAPTESNAHPHATDRVAIVHNGIIENFQALKREIKAAGRTLASDTDTEVVAHLITMALDRGLKPVEAMAETLKRLEGAFALAVLFAGEDDLLVAARRGSPLAVGHGDGEMFLGSDAIALAPFTQAITYLEDGDWAVVTRHSVQIFNDAGKERRAADRARGRVEPDGGQGQLPPLHAEGDLRAAGGDLPHARPLHRFLHRADRASGRRAGRLLEALAARDGRPAARRATPRISGNTGSRSWRGFRSRSISPRSSATARCRSTRTGSRSSSRSRARPPTRSPRSATAASAGQKIGAIVNVPSSSIAREADYLLPTLAGPEIGVASTKAFTCQLTVLFALAVNAARQRGKISAAEEERLVKAAIEVPRHAAPALKLEGEIEALAKELAKASDVLYLGRGTSYPLALEGALKLKEISYIHAEGYAAGELKHGPIALIDETVPVIVIAPHDALFEKTVSNMQEVAARGGRIILLTDRRGAEEASLQTMATLVLPDLAPEVAPIVYAIPAQLIAYHTAVVRGTDVDQPRNLAKSVTVE